MERARQCQPGAAAPMGGRIWIADGYRAGRAILILKLDRCEDLRRALEAKSLPTGDSDAAATADSFFFFFF
jgi:hypothetical protein